MTKDELKELVGLASLEMGIAKSNLLGEPYEIENIRNVCRGFVLLSVGLYKKNKNPNSKDYITI